MRKSLLFIGLMALLVQPAAGQANRAPGDTNGTQIGQSRGSNLKGALTPEQHAMWVRENPSSGKSGDHDALRRQQTEQLAKMSETERQKLVTHLQTSFDRLPKKEKDRIHRDIAERMSEQNAGLH
jgi:hypothetical protein